MSDKIWVVTYVTYYDVMYGRQQPTVTCFNNKENAVKYYDYILGEHYVVSIDECEVYTEFKIFE